MSCYAVGFRSIIPFGSSLAGFMATKIGAPLTVVISGIAVTLLKEVE
jgi:hypothetical protein